MSLRALSPRPPPYTTRSRYSTTDLTANSRGLSRVSLIELLEMLTCHWLLGVEGQNCPLQKILNNLKKRRCSVFPCSPGHHFDTFYENMKVTVWFLFLSLFVTSLHADFGQKELNVWKLLKNRTLEPIANTNAKRIFWHDRCIELLFSKLWIFEICF